MKPVTQIIQEDSSMENVKSLISQMTLEEKASLCSGKNFWELEGVDRLKVPSILVADGPHGLRKQLDDADHLGINKSVPATCFPTASLLASTWNGKLIYKMGVALAEECIAEKVSVILGPGVNIKRSPLGGRNFEYFSEDPYLSSMLAKEMVKGVQSKGVGTSLKHFAVNNQEYRRMIIDAIVDERTLREIYLASFESVVKEAKPATIMCAYNRLNGTYCSENEILLNQVLRDEWGYDGVVITDWGATNDRVKGLLAGQDVEMPGVTKENVHKIINAVRKGELDEKILDQTVERILHLVKDTASVKEKAEPFNPEAHHLLAKEIAGEGIVLLKNDEVLPLDKTMKVALIGRMAKVPRYQGSGSSYMNPTKLECIYDNIIKEIGESNAVFEYAEGYTEDGDFIDELLIHDACKIAAQADVVCIAIGLTESYESEGFDRKTLALPKAHDYIVKRILEHNRNIVVMLSNGAPVAMPWSESVPAIIEGYLNGQAGAGALVDILYGKINPSGRLAETFPRNLEGSKYFPGNKNTVEYREGLYVGYRYYDSFEKEVLFPFGYGLSYTTFEITDASLIQNAWTTDSPSLATVKCKVTNTGATKGKTVIQLYVKDVDSTLYRPDKELKRFEKMELEAGETREITFDLDHRALSFYDANKKSWAIENGTFEVAIGFSSRDLPIKLSFEILESDWRFDQEETLASDANDHYLNMTTGVFNIPDRVFSNLLGRELPKFETLGRKSYDMNTPVAEMKATLIGKILLQVVKINITKMAKQQQNEGMKKMIESVVDEITLRNMAMMSGGVVTFKMAESFLCMARGHYFKGIFHLFSKKQL